MPCPGGSALTTKEYSEEIILSLENMPGSLARALDVLAKKNVNVEGVTAESAGTFGIVRLWVRDPEAASKLLESNGFLVARRPVVTLRVPNKPGELARLCKKLGESGVNIENLFCSARGKDEGDIVIQVSDPAGARKALGL